MIKIFGIKNCDTVKKALKWLVAEGVEHQYHDFRKDGIDREMVAEMVDALGMDLMLNKRGTTWRKLPDDVKAGVTEDNVVDLLVGNEAMIKRPVWKKDGHYLVGFTAKVQDELKG